MPRNVRNFWIEVEVDGRASRIETGPVSSEGGFRVIVRQRDAGGVGDKTVVIVGHALPDGNLVTEAAVMEGARILSQEIRLATKR